VVTVAVVEVDPEGTVTVPALKFAALVLLEPKFTTVPADPAGPVRVTVKVGFVAPPTTEEVDRLTALNTAGLTVHVAVAVVLSPLAVKRIAVELLTAEAVNVNVPEVLPAGIVIDVAESVATALLALREITAPPVAAAPVSVTVPVTLDVVPP
jgi:hypothetical protein